MPPEARPEDGSWDKYDCPVVLMEKALYGHPEAGAHWERHLEAIIKKMGGEPIKDHPSCFWFPDPLKLILIVYVDDLLLSGPADAHEKFWGELVAKVNPEPAEDLDRYLGRHHTFQSFNRLSYNLVDHFISPAEVR